MFVICKEDEYLNTPQYMVYSETTTHTGTHRRVSWTNDINRASVISYLPFQIRHEAEGCKRIKVTVQRIVSIVNE